MRVLVAQGKQVPIRDLTRTLALPDSSTDSYGSDRISEERQLAGFLSQLRTEQQQNIGSADASANIDRQGKDLLTKFVAEMEVKLPEFDIPCFIHPALDGSRDVFVEQPELGFSSSYVDGTRTLVAPSEYEMDFSSKQNLAGPSVELQLLINQAKQQHQMILELQKQLHTLTVIHQQNRQKLLEEEQRKREHVKQELAAKGAVSTQMLSKSSETETVSMINLTPLSGSDQLISCKLDSMGEDVPECNQENIIERPDDEQYRQFEKRPRRLKSTMPEYRSKESLRKEKQVRSNMRAKKCNLSSKKAPKSKAYTTCQHCNKQFHKKTVFTRHLRTHTGEKPFVCKECGVAFSRKDSLVIHQRTHSGEKPFVCKECGVAFSLKSNLRVHQRTHSGEKPFVCKECGVAFSLKSNLRVHQRTHSGSKPFKCLICSQAFTQRTNLSTHLMIHTNEKPFICDICSHSFRRKFDLSEHMNIHSGERPHKCNVCKKTFRQRSALSTHRKVHT